MQFTWDEAKRQANLAKHGLDFADAHRVFAGVVLQQPDARFDYDERRMIAVKRFASFPCGKRLNMKRTPTSKTSAPLDPDEAPPLTREFFKNPQYLVAGKKVSKAVWQKAARAQLAALPGKKRISIMLDAAIIAHFKATAGERGYQTLINETLGKAIAGETLVTELRTVLREELAAYKAE
jgi:uncharacterized protein (DUF4415 family)